MYKTLSKFISRSKASATSYGPTGRTSSTISYIAPCTIPDPAASHVRRRAASQPTLGQTCPATRVKPRRKGGWAKI